MSSTRSEHVGAEPTTVDSRVASPCRRRCCLNEADRCLGCGRLLAEILEWGNADDGRRLAIRALAEERLLAVP